MSFFPRNPGDPREPGSGSGGFGGGSNNQSSVFGGASVGSSFASATSFAPPTTPVITGFGGKPAPAPAPQPEI